MSQPTPKTYDTVVFSRKKTYNDPNNCGSSLASVIQQTDSTGKQQTLAPSEKSLQSPGQAKGLSKLFLNLCNTFGLSNDPASQNNRVPSQPCQQAQPPAAPTAAYTTVAVPPPGPAASPAASTRSTRSSSFSHLPPQLPVHEGKKCLVLDLDETLVHSSFKPTANPDFIIPVEIEGTVHNVYVAKRPGVDEFMRVMAQHYEIVVYTASLSKYADPLLDQLDIHNTITHRLFREHCVRYEGSYVKDLSLLGRDLSQVIFVDNSAMSYIFHPQNAIGCTSFIDDMKDRELLSIQNFLLSVLDTKDVREHLHRWSPEDSTGTSIVG